MRVGTRVRVADGSGIASGKVGTVINRRLVKTDGRGIPVLPGHYRPMTKNEAVIRLDTGEVITMFRNRLQVEG